jgi:hypothetical protein
MFFSPKNSDKGTATSQKEELNFNSEQTMKGPITRVFKKLLDHKNAAKLAISVLCDLIKEHCTMCE